MTKSALIGARRRVSVRPLIADALLWCLLCALLAFGFSYAAAARRYSPVSLRFNTPVSGQAAYGARQYSIERSGETPFWPTFWREDKALFSVEYVTATASRITFSGDASLVWPADYLAGTAPGVTDGAGCAVSSALAWRLWGSMDAVGKTLEVDGETRIVRGVFKGENELALLSLPDGDTSQSFTAAELSGGPPDAARSDAESYAISAGLGKPDAVLMGSGPFLLSRAMAVLPLLILAAYGLILAARLLGGRFSLLRRLLPFILPLGLALGLPSLLALLPSWIIPSRWSDFSFWAALAGQAGGGLREFLSAAPLLRDVEHRLLLLKQAGIFIAAVCCAISICFRWQMRRGRIREASPPE